LSAEPLAPVTASVDELLAAVHAGVRVFDLGREMFVGMPQSPNHPEYRHALPRRHGDNVRADGGSAANDLIVTGTHVGTHIDALSHVSHCGELYGGIDAATAQAGGRFSQHGVETIAPMVTRGVLLDVPASLGVDALPGAYEITPDDLDACVARQGTPLAAGDVALVRSGWGGHWDDREAFVGKASGVPGVGGAGAAWLAAQSVRAAGADTIAFEAIPAGRGHAVLPAHRVLLVEHGIHIIEALALDELAAAGAHEFVFVLSPLKLVGATGSPVRPLALVGARG
jgi:kynurenine formamidase